MGIFSSKALHERIELFTVSIFVTLYIVAASAVALHRYWQFDIFWLDYGILDETIWKLSRFQMPVVINLAPPQGNIVWGDHLNPSMMFTAPVYWLGTRNEITLVAQVVSVALSAVVAYIISRSIIKSPLARVALIVSYLGYVGIQNALITDIHNIVFALLPFMLSVWAVNNRRLILYWIFFLITLGFQENMAGLGVGIGLYLALRKDKMIRIAIFTIIVSIAWGVLATRVIMPGVSGHPYFYSPSLPTVWHEWLTRFIYPPELKLKSILATYATFGFLPVASLSILPMVTEHYLERFVLNLAGTRWDLGLHYNAPLSPIMFLGSLEVLEQIQKHRLLKRLIPWWGVTTIITVFFLHRFYLHGPLLLATHSVFYEQTGKHEFLRDFEKRIPTDGLIMTQNNIAAHFTHHQTMLLRPDVEKYKPRYVALDLRPGQNGNNFFPLTEDEAKQIANELWQNPNYSLMYTSGSLYLFARR